MNCHTLKIPSLRTASLVTLISKFPALRKGDLLRQAIGVSVGALKTRIAKDAGATLTLEQSQWAEKLSEILCQAAKVLGSETEADAWMEKKAIGLGGCVPLDVMLTPEGCVALRDYLARMEYGVYC